MVDVRCASCFRTERWVRDSVKALCLEVVIEGGDRRPAVAPPLAAWRTLRRSRAGEIGPVVGRCPACGQPMIASDTSIPSLDTWDLETPGGTVRVGAAIVGPDGPMTDDDAEAFMNRQYPTRWLTDPPSRVAMQLLILPLLVVPMIVWIAAIVFLFGFLKNGAPSGWTASSF